MINKMIAYEYPEGKLLYEKNGCVPRIFWGLKPVKVPLTELR